MGRETPVVVMHQFVLIVVIMWGYGPVVTSVPFNTAEACLAARDDTRKKSSSIKADCYGTGKGYGNPGKVER